MVEEIRRYLGSFYLTLEVLKMELEDAIKDEEKAHLNYKAMASTFETQKAFELAKKVREIADDEHRHKTVLLNILYWVRERLK